MKPGKLKFSESPSLAIFSYAYRRIWSGRGASFWEILFWSVFALYLGFWFFKLVPYKVEYWLFLSSVVLIPAITPLVVGIGVYKSHVNVGMADESLKSVPLKPIQVLGPRMLAVFLTWVQFIMPLILIAIITQFGLLETHVILVPSNHNIFSDDLLDKVTSSLYVHAYTGRIFLYIAKDIRFTSIKILYVLGFFQVLGWPLVPLTWGYLWASIFQRRGGLFILAYIAYLIVPGFLFLIMYLGDYALIGDWFADFWVQSYTLAFGGLVPSVILFVFTISVWGRRSG